MEVLARAIRKEKEIKGIHIRKEDVKLFVDVMTLDTENPEKVLQLINSYNISGYKVNTEKQVEPLYANSELSDKEIKKAIPIPVATKKQKFRNKFNQ